MHKNMSTVFLLIEAGSQIQAPASIRGNTVLMFLCINPIRIKSSNGSLRECSS